MVFPTWGALIVVAFVALAALVVWQRPPLTPRGRGAYLLVGLCGIGTSFVILGFCWVLSAGVRDERPAAEVWSRMLGTYLGGTLIGVLVAVWGLWLLRKRLKNRPGRADH